MAWNSTLGIYVFWGDKGSGKSLHEAKLILKSFKEYARTEKKYPSLPKRTTYVHIPLSDSTEKLAIFNEHNHLQYWENPRQLYGLKNVDIFWDEIGKDIPAGSYADTPKKLKQVFSHCRKRGNRIIANTQVYEDIDISFRRQIDRAYRVNKMFGNRDISATLPKPKFIYGLITTRKFDPKDIEIERDPKKRISTSGFPSLTLIRKKYIEAYDTTKEIPAYMPDKLEEQILTCIEGENCADPEKNGHPHTIIRHRPI